MVIVMYSQELTWIFPISIVDTTSSKRIQVWVWGGFQSTFHDFISQGGHHNMPQFLDVKGTTNRKVTCVPFLEFL